MKLQADAPAIAAGRCAAARRDSPDMTYQNHGLTTRGASEPYYYEKRMIDEWFRSTFAQRSP